MHPNGGVINGGGHSRLKDMSHLGIGRSGGVLARSIRWEHQ